MKKELSENNFFSKILAARKKHLGVELYANDEKYEIVYAHLTMKLHRWSATNGFDSFVYQNSSEDKGNDSFVTLIKNQAQFHEVLAFSSQDFLQALTPESHLEKLVLMYRENQRNNKNQAYSITPYWPDIPMDQLWKPTISSKRHQLHPKKVDKGYCVS